MLAEAEDALIALIKDAPIGKKLSKVDSLPDLEGENLIKRFGADAPAVYVVMGSFPVNDSAAALKAGLACVAKNSRGQAEARKGDGKAIGLYQIIEAVASVADGASVGSASWSVTGVDFMADEKLYANGLFVGVIRIQTTNAVALPPAIAEGDLADFKTMHADYDIPPHVDAAEHAKWLKEPPDYGTSKPELSDQQNLQP